MSNKKHAMLSASGAERWLICTPSAKLSESRGEGSSSYADEGTLAHQISEYRIKEVVYGVDLSNQINKLMQNELFNEEMMEYVEEYSQFIAERLRQASSGARLIQEASVNLQEFIPDGFGTLDNCIASDEYLEIIDLKYGKGVRVSAEENKQLMVYALGAHRDYSLMYDYDKIVLTVYQPRMHNIDSYEISVANLMRWGNETLRPTALRAFEGIGELIPGDHCRFCRLRATCRANAVHNLEVAKREFDITEITDKQIVKVLQRAKSVKNWITAIEKHALKLAIEGHKYPGMKVVEGRSNRKFTDENAVKTTLVALGFEEDQFMKMKLKGITDMTKLLGAKRFRENIEQYLEKPPGPPTLVDESDKRVEYNSAAAAAMEFDEYEEVD